MSRITNDDQFQFLISCIRHSNNGKIDYTEVAKECSIVSRGAAVKRYSRLMKAHRINTGGDTNTTSTSTSTPTGSTNTTPKKTTNGKRKTTDSETDTESNGKSKASKKGKKDKAVESAEKVVKKAGLDTVKEKEDEDEDVEGGDF
ncbi:uncharacterized protein ASPGLDRAFT_1269082 [Aspergillus glaucus CBS 516.65]|uniref:Myb-like DNA-binding domain-containing protein n=1 Tax=Aspergillus glaucus CBS 516.65 TaxID=1160497 RepID=A0A1L9VS93_ASPGL|nr:hypothetical protein ASPGLDRAFT_1269082 [Aspergillus glaucus CBS 516.65]OJJ86776.1 hypothetical protein ASPGLDRAFT_1269082 [Aspergillus glaucus CBS 516.65]